VYLQYIVLYFNAIVTPDLALIVQIIRRANEAGETHTSLSSRFINEFLLDMAALQCLPPTHEPRVTEHIEHIKELITKVCSSIVANSTSWQHSCSFHDTVHLLWTEETLMIKLTHRLKI